MAIIDELNTIIINNKIPNAILFTGNCGQYKKKSAIAFVKSINCLNRPSLTENLQNLESLSKLLSCDSCRSCVKIESEMHPDIMTITPEPEKAVIKISQIRDLFSAISSKPHEAKMRMVMIEDAHTMNQEASNALLKILEEPPERTFFVLLAKELNMILPTIISRCRHLRFKPFSQNEVAQRLVNKFNINHSVAMIAAKSSNGDIDKAMMLVNLNSNIDWLKRRKWLFNQFIILIKPTQNIGEKFLYGLILAEKLSKETQLLQDSIVLLKSLIRDMTLIKNVLNHSPNILNSGQLINSELFVNLDFVSSMLEIADMLPKTYPLVILEAIHQTEAKLKTNASVRLVLEQFFLSVVSKKSSI